MPSKFYRDLKEGFLLCVNRMSDYKHLLADDFTNFYTIYINQINCSRINFIKFFNKQNRCCRKNICLICHDIKNIGKALNDKTYFNRRGTC